MKCNLLSVGQLTEKGFIVIMGSNGQIEVFDQDQKRVKLVGKGEPMVFVGYHSTGAYKLFDPIRKRMTISRDAIIIEDEHWGWKHNQTSMKKKKTNTMMRLPVSVELEEDVELHDPMQVEGNTEVNSSVVFADLICATALGRLGCRLGRLNLMLPSRCRMRGLT
ncbi:hypothetical protein V8G54_009481 [Vigna mungo]|uniref:Retroviral polymerase SH3-like domain-containing protein n=1 Tax=Vigna mungo TaxID=3915 RepID=A0AAQ3NUW6_VIGMU